ncbi:MAG: acyl dehydratase [Planctomycetes bacterium]|nr:acyl dehydratase [Planctomycetota bacterium]
MVEKKRYYEDCELNEDFISPGRTITEADIFFYSALSSDYSELHTNAEYARQTIFKERIAHGMLGLTIVQGLEIRAGIDRIAGVASLGWTWDFRAPIRINDTLHSRFTLKNKRLTHKKGLGILYLCGQLVNQNEQVVQEGEHRLMVETREAERNI